MDKIEEKVIKKYKKEITRVIKNKYKTRAENEAKEQKFCLKASGNMRKPISELAKDIYHTYMPIIQEEIEIKVNQFLESKQFKKNIELERKIDKKKVSCKSLKKFKEFEIGISPSLLENLLVEVNKNQAETPLTQEELKYILLSIIYKIIDYVKNGFKVKVGTMFTIWLDKRDVRVNLPDVNTRILEDRLIPKVALCNTFKQELFQTINKDNDALVNYYKAKLERFLMLIKRNKR